MRLKRVPCTRCRKLTGRALVLRSDEHALQEEKPRNQVTLCPSCANSFKLWLTSFDVVP